MAKFSPLLVAQRIVALTAAALAATTRTRGVICIRLLKEMSNWVEVLVTGIKTISFLGSRAACSAAIGRPLSASARRIESSEPLTIAYADRPRSEEHTSELQS